MNLIVIFGCLIIWPKRMEACAPSFYGARPIRVPKQIIITETQKCEAKLAGLPPPTMSPYDANFLLEIIEHNKKVEDGSLVAISQNMIDLITYFKSPSMWPVYNPPATTTPTPTTKRPDCE